MTKEEVVTELEAKGAITIIEGKTYSHAGATIHPISYREPLRGGGFSEPKTLKLIELAGGFEYQGREPSILRDPPSLRDFHLTDTEIINGLEAQHPGWKVLNVQKNRDGDIDMITITASDGTNVITKEYAVWDDNGTIDYKEII